MKLVLPTASGRTPVQNRSAVRRSPAERGIALVITLILLSVTLVMALAFLALARREREAVATGTDATQARLAADSALAAAQAQLVANIFATSNSYNYGLFVSTNYITPGGFNNLLGYSTNNNVNYYYPNGLPLNPVDFAQNVGNLQILPRLPVFPGTNGEFRYFLDLNRNGRFDTNGFIAEWVTNSTGQLVTNANFVFEVGDPEWVGILERPDMTHSPINKATSRYAFVAVPADDGLDINAMHNQAKTYALTANDGYFRNQGVGSWELNLAAFFADLNTNIWSPYEYPNNNAFYAYNETNNNFNTGVAFDDARSFLAYRYNFNYNNLQPAFNYFSNFNGHSTLTVFPANNIDEYSDGPLQTNLANINEALNSLSNDGDLNSKTTPWPGADNPNRFYSLVSDLFDTTKLPQAFVNRISQGGSAGATYDRYTFYRLLSQLGTDSSVDSGKLNLNYMNVDVTGNVVPGLETNLVRWPNALCFFTNAADRMLHVYTTNWFQGGPSNFLYTYYGVVTNYTYTDGYGLTNFPYFGVLNQVPAFGIGNIPVYVNGQFVYSSSANHLLQLAANIYDASTNSFYPSVFRPLFSRDQNGNGQNLFVSGYTNIDSIDPLYVGNQTLGPLTPPVDASQLARTNIQVLNMAVNVYGVPWIIGAKKGMPNFNKYGLQNLIQVNRELQVTRSQAPITSLADLATNELLGFSILSKVGANCWNSYSKTYPNQVQIVAYDTLSQQITNDYGAPDTHLYNQVLSTNVIVSNWPGWTNSSLSSQSFVVPVVGATYLLFNSDFYFGTTGPVGFQPVAAGYGWETAIKDCRFPHFGLLTTNRFQLYMVDRAANRIIDYVSFAGPDRSLDINAAIGQSGKVMTYTNMWGTNLASGGTYGVISQIGVSLGQDSGNRAQYWASSIIPGVSVQQQIDGFKNFITPGATPAGYYAATNTAQVPYTPSVLVSDYTSYQVNDPLVHYLQSDLPYYGSEQQGALPTGLTIMHGKIGDSLIPPSPTFSQINERYQPWGVVAPNYYQSSSYDFGNAFNLSYKDPQVLRSDYWDFPTNAYPTVGWLGRVHRGTPWQTVYLKASDILNDLKRDGYGNFVGTNTWAAWAGGMTVFDAANTAPKRDRVLFDIFTTKLDDNAARGSLSVNQTGLAAWSALFSGMVAITNTTINPSSTTPITTAPIAISPAGVAGQNSAIWQIYTNINGTRNLFPNQAFSHTGDILAVPALTEFSPFLNIGTTTSGRASYSQPNAGITDEMYEWLPQQAMSLLRVSSVPRYVIYGYGQSLRPAQGATYSGAGSLFGLVTNYQVMAESAVRAVVQVHPQVTATVNGYVTNYTTTVESYDILPPN